MPTSSSEVTAFAMVAICEVSANSWMHGDKVPAVDEPSKCRSTASESQQTTTSSALAEKAGEIVIGATIEQRKIAKIKNGRCNIDTTNTQRIGHNT